MRFERQSEALWEWYPEAYHDIALAVTDLGSVTALMLILAVVYWVVNRQAGALVASYATAGVAVVLLLKLLFALPRPPVELVGRELDPYGFPSGHAFAAVVVYGGLLYRFEKHREPFWLTIVVGLVSFISVSRVVLGVHYIGDIIAGIVVGIVFLVVMERLTRGEPSRGFLIALFLSVPTVFLTSGAATPLALVAVGASIGGYCGTVRMELYPAVRSRVEGMLLVTVGLGFIVGMVLLEATVVGIHPVSTVAYHASVFAGLFFLPAVIDSVLQRTGFVQ